MAKSVAVVGDVIWDEYVFVETRREAAEAPIPVWDEIRRENRLGGAGNVAKNVKSLDPELDVHLVGVHGSWNNGLLISNLCTGTAMTKRRYVQNKKIIFRHDDQLRYDDVDAQLLLEKVQEYLPPDQTFDAVIFSDYNKGTLTPELVEIFSKRTGLIIIDSKRKDLSLFVNRQKMTVLKVNEQEWGMHSADDVPPEALFNHVVVTKGKDGAALRQFDGPKSRPGVSVIHEEHFPTKRVWSVDVTGCGDTHTAAMAVSLLREGSVRQAVRFANEKASQAVQEFGTAVVK